MALECKDPPAAVLRAALIAASPAVVYDVPAPGQPQVDWVLYKGPMRDKNTRDNAAFILDTTPVNDGRDVSGVNALHHGVQITVRALDYDAGYLKCKGIENWLTQDLYRPEVTIGTGAAARTYLIDCFTLTTPTTFIGVTEKAERQLFTLNGIFTLAEI